MTFSAQKCGEYLMTHKELDVLSNPAGSMPFPVDVSVRRPLYIETCEATKDMCMTKSVLKVALGSALSADTFQLHETRDLGTLVAGMTRTSAASMSDARIRRAFGTENVELQKGPRHATPQFLEPCLDGFIDDLWNVIGKCDCVDNLNGEDTYMIMDGDELQFALRVVFQGSEEGLLSSTELTVGYFISMVQKAGESSVPPSL